MDALITMLAIATPWLLLGLLANGHAADSRDTLPDDHRR